MTRQRMDNVLIVVEDLEAAKAFFAELGKELEGEATNEGRPVDRVVGLDDVRADIAMMRTSDGHGHRRRVARLRGHGAELAGEIAQYEDVYRVCFLRGPERIIIGLAERLS